MAQVCCGGTVTRREPNANDDREFQILVKPRGEAGDGKHGFNLREAMNLEGDENKELYEAIQVFKCLY